jgi:hypothetical protein
LGPYQYEFFISHVSEDSNVVKQLKNEIAAASGRGGRPAFDCFLDVHAWPSANELSQVIKKYLLKSKYLVAWVTPAYLRSARGWVWTELAYAELIEIGMNSSPAIELPYIVPVFMDDVTVDELSRTPLLRYWQRRLPTAGRPITEIARALIEFYDQELRKQKEE